MLSLEEFIAIAKYNAQIDAANNLRRMLKGSQICNKYRNAKVQCAYMLRSMASIHGAAKKDYS